MVVILNFESMFFNKKNPAWSKLLKINVEKNQKRITCDSKYQVVAIKYIRCEYFKFLDTFFFIIMVIVIYANIKL